MATLLFKVYLSSTLKDLVEERKAVEDALRDQCVVTHSYRASEDSVALSCLQDVADCDLYIGIVGLRYGFIPTSGIVNENGLSITELEYRHAKENDIPRLMFLKDENVIPYTQTDAKSKEHPSERIEGFRSAANTDQRAAVFTSISELREGVLKAFNAFAKKRLSGTSGSSRGLLIGVDPATLETGAVFKDVDAPWCPEMVVIRSGRFMMGSVEGEPDAYPEESPQHLVTIDYRFALGRYLVTFTEFEAFCAASSRRPPGDEGWSRGRFPVINVSWNDAQAFVAWLSSKTKRPYRLPTEAEWEYACRAGTTTRTFRGDSISVKHANYDHEHGRTSEVGSYPANPWGLYDLLGNVWEHVEDPYHETYVGAPDDGSAWLSDADLSRRVVRGGSFSYGSKDNRSAVRCDHDVTIPDRQHGFRVAFTI